MKRLVAVCAVACGTRSEPAPEPVVPVPVAAIDAAVRGGGIDAKPAQISSPLPEAGPHPEYPTPVAAGTDKIFLLEEPDRGPTAPRDFELPAGGKSTEHAFCDAGRFEVLCRGARGARLVGWRVRRWPELAIAQRLRGTAVEETYAYQLAASKPKQTIVLDAYDRVRSAKLFATPHRYTMRLRDGGNGLDGCGAMDLELDKAGHVAAARCLQWNGEPMRDTTNVARTAYKRDKLGFVVEESRFGLDGAAAVPTSGVHRIAYTRDGDGRVVEERYHGVDGKPVASTRNCHGRRTEHDERGLVARSICLGADAKASNDTSGTAIHEYAYDARGCRIRMRYLAAPGSKDPLGNGVDYVVDDHCEVTSHTCVKPDGNRKVCGVGEPARYDYKLDPFGRAIAVSHYGVDGSPAKDPSTDVFEVRNEYDDLDNKIAYACFDAAAKPVKCSTFGFHRQQIVFDHAGREVARTFFDTEGLPTTNIGAKVRRFTYDNYDHSVETVGLDANANVIDSLGMATRRNLYDAAHRLFAIILLDKAGKPARYTGCYGGSTCPKQWHAVRLVRITDGSVTFNKFFDAAGQLIQTVDCSKSRCFK